MPLSDQVIKKAKPADKPYRLAGTFQSIWDQSIQPQLRRMGVDVQRYPPQPQPQPDWTEIAFMKLLAARDAQSSSQMSDADAFVLFCARHAQESYSQLFQDLFVRWQLGDKREGFFVEFGATDGVSLSNSKCLEADFQWRGILAEPARCWHERLSRNRTCTIDTRCVWTSTGETLRFNEVPFAELSTVESFSDKDHHSASRQNGTLYEVQTVSLNDLLAEHEAPAVMDYLSIDTEGSELSILENLDFSKYRFNVITVEHNCTPNREKIFSLLNQYGYQRKFTQFSRFDDWYVHSSLPSKSAFD